MEKENPPLIRIYRALYRAWGPQHWWPGESRAEVMVGAVLTQNTAWTNVEKALARLRRESALSLAALNRVDHRTLAEWIRPAGYYNVKAKRLKALVGMISQRFDGRPSRMAGMGTQPLRRRLLEVPGIGPETADSILLYAFGRPVFVVDAYTRRILSRHGWAEADAGYDDIAAMFSRILPCDVYLYNEYHALIVAAGKCYCKSRPSCDRCPLRRWLPPGGPLLVK